MQYTSRDVYEYIAQQTDDPIIERKTCRLSGQPFAVYQSDLDFYDKISPTFETSREMGDKLICKYPKYYSRTKTGTLKIQIPTPTLCPEERQRRRLAFRNERKLYRSRCDATGEQIISMYSPDKIYKVYNQTYRLSDQWSANDYQCAIELGRNAIEIFRELLSNTPFPAVYNPRSENSDYANISLEAKDCYLAFVCSYSEEVLYSHWAIYCKKSLDLYRCVQCENSYEMNGGIESSNCSFSSDIESCHNCHGCHNMIGCSQCYMCTNMVNASYCINNIQYSPEEYYKKITSITTTEIQQFLQKAYRKTIRKSLTNFGGENVRGNGNFYSKDIIFCSNLQEGYNNKYYDEGAKGLENSYDCNYGATSTFCIETVSPVGSHNTLYSFFIINCNDTLYSRYCQSCSNCFGCIGLRNKSYCIFNKQYTKEEYHELVPQLIARMIHDGEWGEFFDPSLSPFGYNETVAMEYFPLTKEEALARGYNRCDYSSDPVIPEGVQTLTGDQVPDDITTVSDDILTQVIICEVSQRPFIIQKMELEFYRKHGLPLPRKHPDVRHQERLALRHGRTLHLRTCDHTGEKMLSVYPQDTPFQVYSEKAYQQEVFG